MRYMTKNQPNEHAMAVASRPLTYGKTGLMGWNEYDVQFYTVLHRV